MFYKKKNIQNIVDSFIKDRPYINTKEQLNRIITDERKWILNYLNKDTTVNDSKVYNDTFKFISDVMQYKIPYYLNFFVSVYKLFISKNPNPYINPDDINTYKIAMFFENGMNDNIDQNMVDFGFPSELLKILNDNNIIINNKIDIDSINIIDDYQKEMLKDFVTVMYK